MRTNIWVLALTVQIVVGGLAGAPPARADTDTDFAAELHTYGIYGPRDYNAWLAKISCKRVATGLDRNAFDAAKFLSTNLARDTTTQQTWQFLSAALSTYCPDQLPVLSAVANTDR